MTDDTITRLAAPPVELAGLVLVTGYDTAQNAANILHPKLNGAGFNVTYRPAKLRSGLLTCVFESAADAFAALVYLGTAYRFTLVSIESEVDMTFVVGSENGSAPTRPRKGDGDDEWLIEVPFQEVD
jgi:hypothetical protein